MAQPVQIFTDCRWGRASWRVIHGDQAGPGGADDVVTNRGSAQEMVRISGDHRGVNRDSVRGSWRVQYTDHTDADSGGRVFPCAERIFYELNDTVHPFPGVASVAPIRSSTSPDNSGNRFCGYLPAIGGTLPRRATARRTVGHWRPGPPRVSVVDTTVITIAVW